MVASPQIATDLGTLMEILGTTKASLWPFVEAVGTNISGMAVTDLTASETGASAEALEDDFSPLLHPGGIYSYHFNPTGDHHLAGADNANYSFTDGSNDDAAMSVGCFIQPNAIATNVMLGKYDSAGNLEEWRFFIDSGGLLSYELHDASASATEIGTTTTALTVGRWVFCVGTYDGSQAAPDMKLYLDARQDGDLTTTETGDYVGMENTAAPLTIGCSGVTATPVAEYHGRLALPFLCEKELSQADVTAFYNVGRYLLGI